MAPAHVETMSWAPREWRRTEAIASGVHASIGPCTTTETSSDRTRTGSSRPATGHGIVHRVLDQVLSVCLVDLGSAAEARDRSLSSVEAFGFPASGSAPTGCVARPRVWRRCSRPRTRPWGRRGFSCSSPARLVQAPDTGRAARRPLQGHDGPVAPWASPPELLLPDPLHVSGARLVRVDGDRPVAHWAIGEALYPAGSTAPYLVESRRSPFEAGSAAARWAIAVAGRRMRQRGDESLSAAEGLLDASLLAWSGEPPARCRRRPGSSGRRSPRPWRRRSRRESSSWPPWPMAATVKQRTVSSCGRRRPPRIRACCRGGCSCGRWISS